MQTSQIDRHYLGAPKHDMQAAVVLGDFLMVYGMHSQVLSSMLLVQFTRLVC